MRNRTVSLACGLLLLGAGCGGDDRSHVISGAVTGDISEKVLVRLVTQTAALAYVALTTPDGRYAFSRLPDGEYEVVPETAGFAFDPPSRRVTVSGGDVAGIDFTSRTARAGGAAVGGP